MFYSIKELQSALIQGKVSAREVVEEYLKRIEAESQLNCFIEVFKETALEAASRIDAKIASNEPLGKLFGCVVAIKDNIVYKGHKVSAASHILEGYTSIYSSTVVEKMLQTDAIIIGRLNCDEFAMGSSNENSFYGPVLNPIDEDRVPGGSSGGSAAAVKANLCTIALGSDTGGSIRQPASFCGVVGLKPSYGRVSRYGLIAFGSSFDQIGPLTRNVEDAALVMEVIAGKDDFDATVSTKEVPLYSELMSLDKKCKIGYYEEAIEHPSINDEVKAATLNLIEQLTAKGHEVVPLHFNEMDYIVPTYYVLTTAEASSNLARFDGIRYGYRDKQATDIDSTYRLSRSNGFGWEVQRRIMSGTFVLSAGYYDAYYSKAQKVRRIIKDETIEQLKECDFILSPTAPSPAYKLGEKTDDPIEMYLGDIFTVQANLVGIPAISLPMAESKEGLPIGIQLMANKFEEEKLLAFANELMAY